MMLDVTHMSQFCGWLIVRVCVVLRRTIDGFDRPGLCSPEKDY